MDQAVSLSTANNMIPNVDKTKHMVISFLKQPTNIPPVMIEGTDIQRVNGVVITDKLTWTLNTTYICSSHVIWVCNQASARICMSCMAYHLDHG